MISTINSLSKINKGIKSPNGVTQYNSSLPISIKVLGVSGYLRYSLQLGNTTMSTKSMSSLEIGSKYWGVVKNNKNKNSIQLSNLIKKPNCLQLDWLPFILSMEDMKTILESDNSGLLIQNYLIDLLDLSNNKDDFDFIMNLLYMSSNGIYLLPFESGDEYNILQYKSKSSSLDFFITFDNLGALKGEIKSYNKNIELNITTQFEQSKVMISKELVQENSIFNSINISINQNLKPLFEIKNRLLELSA